jgi:hypothetical protein
MILKAIILNQLLINTCSNILIYVLVKRMVLFLKIYTIQSHNLINISHLLSLKFLCSQNYIQQLETKVHICMS